METTVNTAPNSLEYLVSPFGRSNRKQLLIAQMISLTLIFISGFILSGFLDLFGRQLVVGSSFLLALYITHIGVIRRLHDANHSRWKILLLAIPFVNLYVAYLLYCVPSNEDTRIRG